MKKIFKKAVVMMVVMLSVVSANAETRVFNSNETERVFHLGIRAGTLLDQGQASFATTAELRAIPTSDIGLGLALSMGYFKSDVVLDKGSYKGYNARYGAHLVWDKPIVFGENHGISFLGGFYYREAFVSNLININCYEFVPSLGVEYSYSPRCINVDAILRAEWSWANRKNTLDDRTSNWELSMGLVF